MFKSSKPSILSVVLIISFVFTPGVVHAQESFPAEINKSFSPISIVVGQVSRLSVTIFNPNSFQLDNAAWIDNLTGVQPGIFIANPANVANSCSGSVTAVPGTTILSLSGGAVTPQVGVTPGSCTVSIDVSSTTPGNLINTIPTGGLTSTGDLGGGVTVKISNTTPASATLHVGAVQPPAINKNFNPNTVWAGQTSQLTINIVNTDLGTALTQASLTDSLPPNVFLAPNVSPTLTNCGSASLAAVSGTRLMTLSNATIPANSTCVVRVNVISSVQGVYTNDIPAGAVQTQQGVTNASPASSPLNVQEIGLLKSFSPANIPAGGNSTLTITLQNPTANDYTGVNLTDGLPAGLTIFGTPASPQCGGTISSTATSVTLTGGLIPHSLTPPTPVGTCTIVVQVTAPVNSTTATRTNTIPVGALTTTQGISNRLPASSNLGVQAALTVLKAFSPATIGAGGTSTVTVTLRNATGTPLTGVHFTDVLPANLMVSGIPVSPQCGGTITNTTTSVTLTGGTIPASPAPPAFATCTITFQVTSTFAAPYTNTIPAGDITTDQGISNVTNTNSNTLNVAAGTVPVTGNKSFAPATISAGGNTRLRINITAPADTNLTNYSIVDNLTTGVTISNVNTAGNPTPAVKTANCIGGTLTAVTGAGSVSWTGGTINAGQLCRIDVWVTSSTPGVVTNVINPADITNDQGRTLANPISSNLTVTNLSMSKVFTPTTVAQNGISTLTITLTNTNSAALINVSLTDALSTMGGTVPTSGVYIAAPPNASTTCGAGVITFPDARTISMSGGTIPAQNGSVPGICTISVNVRGRGNPATRTNTIPIANVGGTVEGTTTVIRPVANATANLTIANLIIGMVKGFNPLTVFGGSASTMSVQLVNPNDAALTGITFTDSMPSGMILANPPNLNTGTCGGTLAGAAGDSSFTFSGGSLPVATSCTLTLSITMTVNGNLTNVIPANAVTTLNGASNIQPIEASLTNLPGASVSKFFSPNPIVAGAANYSFLTITITNTSSFALTGMGLNDALPGSLPAGLEIAGAPAPSPVNNCGGTLTAATGTQTIQLAGGSLAGASSCTIIVGVTSTVPGQYLNTIPAGRLTNNQGASNTLPATDTLIVTAPALASLGDFVWNDLNANGIQDAGESGIDNVTVNLYNGNTALVAATTTSGGGLYSFTQLLPGDYFVEFVPPAGYSFSPADQSGNDSVDSDANIVTGRTIITTLIAGENELTWDAGLYQPVTNLDIKKTVNPAEATIGEIVTYQVSAAIPPGFFRAFELEDTLDPGLAFVACHSIGAPGLTTDVAGDFASVCSNPTVDNAGGGTPADVDRHVVFNFGTLTNNGNGSATLTVTYRAIVLDIASNVDGVTRNNSAIGNWAGGGSGPVNASIKIIEPKLLIHKTADIGFLSNGTGATITLTLSHASDSHADAYDMDVVDVLPTGMDYVANSIDCTLGAQDPDAGTCVIDNSDPTKPTIRAHWTAFTRAGGTGEIRFNVMGNALLPVNGSVTNTAQTTWTSLPGPHLIAQSFSVVPNQFAIERHYDPHDPVNFYGVQDALTFTPVGGVGGGGTAGAGGDNGSDGGGEGGIGRNRRSTIGGFLIPVTGFPPGIHTQLSDLRFSFNSTGLVVEIPVLGIKVPITGVQLMNGVWDVSWLWNQAGWLEGTAYPTYDGNSVLMAHVINSDGKAGPFVRLNRLGESNYIFVYSGDYRYIYKVVSNTHVQPNDISVLRHEEESWLTLITCDNYDVETGNYLSRVVVRAKLLDVSLLTK